MNSTECFFFQPTDYTSSANVCKWCGKEKYQHKSEQKQLIIDIMNEDAKDGLYKQQTAVEWLVDKLIKAEFINNPDELIDQAKAMEKQQIEDAFGVGCHHESKRLVGYQDIAEQYYNEEYGGGK
jgi:hypothetical protein